MVQYQKNCDETPADYFYYRIWTSGNLLNFFIQNRDTMIQMMFFFGNHGNRLTREKINFFFTSLTP